MSPPDSLCEARQGSLKCRRFHTLRHDFDGKFAKRLEDPIGGQSCNAFTTCHQEHCLPVYVGPSAEDVTLTTDPLTIHILWLGDSGT